MKEILRKLEFGLKITPEAHKRNGRTHGANEYSAELFKVELVHNNFLTFFTFQIVMILYYCKIVL